MQNEYSIIPISTLIDERILQEFSCRDCEEEDDIDRFLREDAKKFDLYGYTKTFIFMKKKEANRLLFVMCRINNCM